MRLAKKDIITDILLIFILLFGKGCATDKQELPVVPIAVFEQETSSHPNSLANALCVDKQYGLFLTNAHVIAMGGQFKLKIFDQWYPAETNEIWINWRADLAIVKIIGKLPTLTDFALLEFLPTDPTVNSVVFLAGYDTAMIAKSNNYQDNYIFSLLPVTSEISQLNISYSDFTMEQLIAKYGAPDKIPQKKQRLLYQHYILLKAIENKIVPGLSGSPYLIVQENKKMVVGILSAADTNNPPQTTQQKAIAIPAKEASKLLELVQKNLTP